MHTPNSLQSNLLYECNSLHVIFFTFQPITAAAMCTVAIDVLEPRAFNSESQYFIPLFNEIS
jgi:hypothetical protein